MSMLCLDKLRDAATHQGKHAVYKERMKNNTPVYQYIDDVVRNYFASKAKEHSKAPSGSGTETQIADSVQDPYLTPGGGARKSSAGT